MNAVYSPFQANKIKRLVYSKGTMYKVTRNPMTKYGEPDENATEGIKESYIRALLHSERSSKYRTEDTSAARFGADSSAMTKFSSREMLLCCYNDAHNIRAGDKVQDVLSRVEYEVENATNIQEGNFAIDLYLRRVIHGIDV